MIKKESQNIEETQQQDLSSSTEKTLSDQGINIDKLPRLIFSKNLSIFFNKDFSYISLLPIIPIDKIDSLFKLYNIQYSKEEIISKIKEYKLIQESRIDKICEINNIKIQNSRGNITIIDNNFNNSCIELSKTSNDALQIIADKISLGLFNNKLLYQYEKSSEYENMIYAIAKFKSDENIIIKSDYFESEKSARKNVNEKILSKYLSKKIFKEIMINIGKQLKEEDKIKIEKKERYEIHLAKVGGDRKLLNNKRKLNLEEFNKLLPYYNMLNKDKNKANNNPKKKKLKNNPINNNNILSLNEIDEDFFINTEGIPINEILLGDPCIVNNHLNDFKYTPLKIFEMIRDSEKYRGIDFTMSVSNINDKKYSVKFEVVIISQKLGIKVEGYGKSKEEAANKCCLKLLTVLFKNIFKTYMEVHDYFVTKNGKYLDIILKKDNYDNGMVTYNENVDENIQNNSKKRKIIEDDDDDEDIDYKKKDKKVIPIYVNENNIDSQNGQSKNDIKNSYDNSKYDFEQGLYNELISNNSSGSEINIINNLNMDSQNTSTTKEMEYLLKSSNFSSEENYSISNCSKKKI